MVKYSDINKVELIEIVHVISGIVAEEEKNIPVPTRRTKSQRKRDTYKTKR